MFFTDFELFVGLRSIKGTEIFENKAKTETHYKICTKNIRFNSDNRIIS